MRQLNEASGLSNFEKIKASNIGVIPAYVDGMESKGLLYLLWADSPAAGAQCSFCNTVVWVDPFEDSVLSERKPDHVPSSGGGYKQYYDHKIDRFLASIPPCPSCGHQKFDRFVNNVNVPRLEDGTVLTDLTPDSIKNVDPEKVDVWFLKKG